MRVSSFWTILGTIADSLSMWTMVLKDPKSPVIENNQFTHTPLLNSMSGRGSRGLNINMVHY